MGSEHLTAPEVEFVPGAEVVVVLVVESDEVLLAWVVLADDVCPLLEPHACKVASVSASLSARK